MGLRLRAVASAAPFVSGRVGEAAERIRRKTLEAASDTGARERRRPKMFQPGARRDIWLPVPREEPDLAPKLRVDVPDPEKLESESPPRAVRIR
jgi:hypothetical protein